MSHIRPLKTSEEVSQSIWKMLNPSFKTVHPEESLFKGSGQRQVYLFKVASHWMHRALINVTNTLTVQSPAD